MIDVYRSEAGRDAVAQWCDERLAAWPTPHTRRTLDVVPAARTLVEKGAAPSVRQAASQALCTHVVEARAGQAAPGAPEVVLLPDSASCAAMLTDAADAFLGAGAGVVRLVDVPGQPGRSESQRPRRGSAPWAAAWLDGLLDALAREDGATAARVVVGHSAGAVPLLGSRTEGVGRVLVAPGGIVPFRVGPRMTRDTARWSMRATPATSAALARHLVADEPQAELVEWLRVLGSSCRTLGAPRPLPRFVLDAAFGDGARVVVGEDDETLSATALAAATSRRDVSEQAVDVVAGMGHLPTAAQWRLVARLALRGRS